ncbi:MAG: substrate-binding periplasmic protein [Candidatus Hodarchaeota archaeon]
MIACVVGGFLSGWLIPPLFTAVPSGTILDQIKTRGSIIIGTSSDWPPFEIWNTTTMQYEGFDIDLCELIATELSTLLGVSITIDWSDMSFGALIDACLTGLIDMIAAAMFVTPTRAEQLAFSMGYVRTNMVCIVLENSTITINDYNDLLGYEVDVLSGSAEMWELDDAGIPYNDYPKADVIITNLVANVSQVAFVDEPVFTIWSKIYDLKIVYTVLAEPCALFCRWENPELMAVINDVILKAYTDGTLDGLVDKWFT